MATWYYLVSNMQCGTPTAWTARSILRNGTRTVKGRSIGPLSSDDLRAHVRDGRLTHDCFVRKESCGRWVSAGKVKGLFDPAPKQVVSFPIASEDMSPGVIEAGAIPSQNLNLLPWKTQLPELFPKNLIFAVSGIALVLVGILWASSRGVHPPQVAPPVTPELARRSDEERDRRLKQEADQRAQELNTQQDEVAEKESLLVAIATIRAKQEDESLRRWKELEADIQREGERSKMDNALFYGQIYMPRIVIAPNASRFNELLPKFIREVRQEFGKDNATTLRSLLQNMEGRR